MELSASPAIKRKPARLASQDERNAVRPLSLYPCLITGGPPVTTGTTNLTVHILATVGIKTSAVTFTASICTAPLSGGNSLRPFWKRRLTAGIAYRSFSYSAACTLGSPLPCGCAAAHRRQWSTSLMMRAVLRCSSSSDSPVHLWSVASLRGGFVNAAIRDASPTRCSPSTRDL